MEICTAMSRNRLELTLISPLSSAAARKVPLWFTATCIFQARENDNSPPLCHAGFDTQTSLNMIKMCNLKTFACIQPLIISKNTSAVLDQKTKTSPSFSTPGMSKCQQIRYLIDLLTVEVVSVERTGGGALHNARGMLTL